MMTRCSHNLKIVTLHYIQWILLLVLSQVYMPARAQSEAEYRLKAVFLFNFTQFIEWPANAFNTSVDPMIIGILGNNPFGQDLNEAVNGEKGNGRFIIVRRYNSIYEIENCHILFINRNDTTDLELINSRLPEHALLVSDDSEDFLEKGGMIRFLTRNNKIQLQINLTAIRTANLTISSKLLRLAELYTNQ